MRHSQYEEDDIIREFFGDKPGRFLDLGAADGQKSSNTRALFERGWKGVCVEPNPRLFAELFDLYRQCPDVTLVNAALSIDGRELRFYQADQLSTAFEPTVGLENMAPLFTGHHWLPSITPRRLAQLTVPPFDFISLDCEGMDYEIAYAAGSLFAGAKLICWEHTLPGTMTTDEYLAKMRAVFAANGFKREIGRTEGNILVAP